MGMLQCQQYLEFIQIGQKISPYTLDSYANAMKACNIYEFDPDNVSKTWEYLNSLLDSGKSYGQIQNMIKVIKGLLRIHGVEYKKDYYYNLLTAKLSKRGTVPKPYSEQDIRQLLLMLEGEDYDLFRAAMLCTYAGLRISGCQWLKYQDFIPLETLNVLTFKVHSKGTHYIAAISKYAFDAMKALNYGNSEYVVNYNPNLATPFGDAMRNRLDNAMAKHAMQDMWNGKKPFHSMRKFFMHQIAQTIKDPEDRALLMGHWLKATVGNKHYLLEDKKNIPDTLRGRVAIAYSQTPLMQLELI